MAAPPNPNGLPEATAAEVVKAAKNCPLLRSERLLVNGSPVVLLGTSPTRFAHGLGRRPEGYVVGSVDKAAVIVRDADDLVTPPADPRREIVLHASLADTTAQLLLY